MGIALKKVKDQVIVITGATSGVGLATARMAAAKGAKVVVAARNSEALAQLTAELNREEFKAVAVTADVGREEEVNRIAETAITEFGGFDTWVNNAGVMIFGEALAVDTEDMKRLFDTNFWGTVYGSKAAVAYFKDKDKPGALINVGSAFGDRGVVLQSAYAAAKFAVHGWTESLRMEMEKNGIPVSVTLIHPGRINTPYNKHAKSYLEKQPAHVGYMYAPEAVAEAILFAAGHSKRDLYVGAQAKFGAVIGRAAPGLTDKLMERTLYRTQQAERPSDPLEDNALYQAGADMNERGAHIGWSRERSFYIKATKRPMLTAIAVAGLSVLIVAVKRKKNV